MSGNDPESQVVELSFEQMEAFHRGDTTALDAVHAAAGTVVENADDQLAQEIHDTEQQALLDAQNAGEKPADDADKKADAANPGKKEPAIPLSRHTAILKAANLRAKEASNRATEAANQLALMQEKGKSTVDIDKALDKIKEDFPSEVADVLIALRDQNVALAKRLEAKEVFSRQEAEDTDRSEVMQLIAANPDLNRWHIAFSKEDATPEQKVNFETAQAHDLDLQKSRFWATQTQAERFTEAVRLTRLELGLTPAVTSKKELPKQGAGQAPSSLSNLPAGAPPAASGAEAWANADPFALMAQTQGMNSKQYKKFIQDRFGAT